MTGFSVSMGNCCEHCNERSCSIRSGPFLGHVMQSQHLNSNQTSRSLPSCHHCEICCAGAALRVRTLVQRIDGKYLSDMLGWKDHFVCLSVTSYCTLYRTFEFTVEFNNQILTDVLYIQDYRVQKLCFT